MGSLAVVLAYFALTLSALVYIVWFYLLSDQTLSREAADWGSFGDFFGGTVGPFIGFASIILLVETLRLQRRGLEEQREHLEAAAREAVEQNRITLQQAFEQSFFRWLQDYKAHLSATKFSSKSEIVDCPSPRLTLCDDDLKGGEALHRIGRLLNDVHIYAMNGLIKPTDQEYKEMLAKRWNAIYMHPDGSLRSAIRTLYGIMRWIHTHCALTQDEKKHYFSIIKAQLTDPELIILLANALTERGKKYREFITEYDLLNNLEADQYEIMKVIEITFNDARPQP